VSDGSLTTESRVNVEWTEGNLFLGSDDAGHTVVYDSSISAKSRSRGIGPMKALLTSLGACSGMDIVAILGKRKQRLESLKMEVSGRRPEHGHPRPYTQVHIRFLLGGRELDEKYVQEAVTDSMTKFCSVAATIDGRAKVTYSYEIVRP